MKSNIAYIGLGSNLSDPSKQILMAYTAMNELPSSRCIALSPLYQSKAIGPEQPDFINAAAKLETQLSALELLDALQNIEHQQKRIRKQHWGPRTIDLDILLFNQDTLTDARLTIPHPHMVERNFVLVPLLNIEPHLQMPSGQSIQTLLETCEYNDLKPIGPQN